MALLRRSFAGKQIGKEIDTPVIHGIYKKCRCYTEVRCLHFSAKIVVESQVSDGRTPQSVVIKAIHNNCICNDESIDAFIYATHTSVVQVICINYAMYENLLISCIRMPKAESSETKTTLPCHDKK